LKIDLFAGTIISTKSSSMIITSVLNFIVSSGIVSSADIYHKYGAIALQFGTAPHLVGTQRVHISPSLWTPRNNCPTENILPIDGSFFRFAAISNIAPRTREAVG
jgi:hypothetical protein